MPRLSQDLSSIKSDSIPSLQQTLSLPRIVALVLAGLLAIQTILLAAIFTRLDRATSSPSHDVVEPCLRLHGPPFDGGCKHLPTNISRRV